MSLLVALVYILAGDVDALQELSGCASAFRESDSRGWLPLHAAAVQLQPDVLHTVLQGESENQCDVSLIKLFSGM